MATRLSVNEAKTRLSEYLNRVNYRGERFVVERHGKPVGALVSLEDLARLLAEDGGGWTPCEPSKGTAATAPPVRLDRGEGTSDFGGHLGRSRVP
jgi:prevent-host-death family protein